MNNNSRLNTDEIMCLQMAGLPTSEIIKIDLTRFEELYETNPIYEEYIGKANTILDRLEALAISAITVHDDNFPKRLLTIGNDCPAIIYCLGNTALLRKKKAVAIIGARACDKEGYSMAYKLAMKYAHEGNVIVSGLALGCDTAAHRGAVDVKGDTIAVVATGLNLTHPKENIQLQKDILANNGLLISEQPYGTKANPTRLIARNRLQAALSDSVILAQCPEHSGSIHTMRFARKYDKTCFAATYTHRTDINSGNYYLIESSLAMPVCL
ncbi:MAG: DNA-protecting protein DprA [Muribaculaceae bacterium]|nr:DNA-protecting protein DprA [Muribaculaceae bacterium]